MITKEIFIKVIGHIQAQEDINDQFDDALTLVCESRCLYGIKNQYKDALFLILREIFDDRSDYIGWWLYETDDYKVYEIIDGKEKEYDLKQPEALYDFLIANKDSHSQKDGSSQNNVC